MLRHRVGVDFFFFGNLGLFVRGSGRSGDAFCERCWILGKIWEVTCLCIATFVVCIGCLGSTLLEFSILLYYSESFLNSGLKFDSNYGTNSNSIARRKRIKALSVE